MLTVPLYTRSEDHPLQWFTSSSASSGPQARPPHLTCQATWTRLLPFQGKRGRRAGTFFGGRNHLTSSIVVVFVCSKHPFLALTSSNNDEIQSMYDSSVDNLQPQSNCGTKVIEFCDIIARMACLIYQRLQLEVLGFKIFCQVFEHLQRADPSQPLAALARQVVLFDTHPVFESSHRPTSVGLIPKPSSATYRIHLGRAKRSYEACRVAIVTFRWLCISSLLLFGNIWCVNWDDVCLQSKADEIWTRNENKKQLPYPTPS